MGTTPEVESFAEKRITGNPGKRPLQPVVPEPAEKVKMCPLAVQQNPCAEAYWDLFVGMTAPGHLKPTDAPLLARLCMALAYADEANAKIEATGLLVKAPSTGTPVQSPFLAIMNRQTEIARKLAAELALPPAQRSRVAMARVGAPPDDEWGL